jgi:hypothetical protein
MWRRLLGGELLRASFVGISVDVPVAKPTI